MKFVTDFPAPPPQYSATSIILDLTSVTTQSDPPTPAIDVYKYLSLFSTNDTNVIPNWPPSN